MIPAMHIGQGTVWTGGVDQGVYTPPSLHNDMVEQYEHPTVECILSFSCSFRKNNRFAP